MSKPTPWTRLKRWIDDYETKAAQRPDEYGFQACENIANLVKLERAISNEIDREIIRARDQGATWAQIPFGRSKQAAQQRHARAVDRVNKR